VFFHRQVQVCPREDCDDISSLQKLIIWRSGVVDCGGKVKWDQAGTKIALVKTLDQRIFPVDLRAGLTDGVNDWSAYVPELVVALVARLIGAQDSGPISLRIAGLVSPRVSILICAQLAGLVFLLV
jgi:hypothetical protein